MCKLVQSLGGKIDRGVEVVALDQTNDSIILKTEIMPLEYVVATLQTCMQKFTVKAKYLVGCDGAHSFTRKAIHGSFE